MTDLLIRDEPNDTGEIPAVDPGTTTQNLADYISTGPFPALRRGELLDEVPYEPHTIGVVDLRPSAPGPDPTPPFPPPPPPPTPRRSVLYVMPPRRPFAYAGRHRPGWHGKLRRFLADVTAPLVRAW